MTRPPSSRTDAQREIVRETTNESLQARAFFAPSHPISPEELSRLAQGTLIKAPSGVQHLDHVAPINRSTPHSIAYVAGMRFLDELLVHPPGAVLIRANLRDQTLKEAPHEVGEDISSTLLETKGTKSAAWAALWSKVHCVVCDHPERSIAQVISHVYRQPYSLPTLGVHPDASVDNTASIGKNCTIGAGVRIGRYVVVGEHTIIAPNATLDDGVVVGEHCHIGAGVHLSYCIVGDRVRIRAGASIGNRGMGFTVDEDGSTTDVPQIGRVVVGRDVEVGSQTTIDRGKFDDTIIGDGCRIDNQVQIAHNVRIGKHCIVLAHTTIAGSATLEDRVVCGGMVGIEGHIRIGTGALVFSNSAVMGNLAPNGRYGSLPAGAMPEEQFRRMMRFMRKVARGDISEP